MNGTFRKKSVKNTERSKNNKQPEDVQKQRIRSGNHNPKNQFTKRNKESENHGFFSKYLPQDAFDIIKDMKDDPVKILWQNIKNAMEPLKERERKIIALNLFEKVAMKDIASLINIRPKRVGQIKRKALETIADILYG